MKRLSHLLCTICLGLACSNCTSINARLFRPVSAGGIEPGYFAGVRADCAALAHPEKISESPGKFYPLLLIADIPLSLVGDLIFLPADIYEHAVSKRPEWRKEPLPSGPS